MQRLIRYLLKQMKIANQQKLVIGVATLAIIALITTTVWSRPGFLYQPPSAEQVKITQQKQQQELEEYRKYLATLEADPAASYEVITNTLDTKALGQQVQTDLGATKPAFEPKVDIAQLNISENQSVEAVQEYVSRANQIMTQYANIPSTTWDKVFTDTPDPLVTRDVQQQTNQVVADMYRLSVPRSALDMHVSALKSLAIQNQLIADSARVTTAITPRGAGRWSNTYPAFKAAQQTTASLNDATNAVSKKYGLNNHSSTVSVFGIKSAQAQVPVQTITDYPRLFEQILRNALGVVILNYIKTQVLNWVIRFDKDHTIANFLYYNNALTAKNTDDYFKKYVNDEQGYDEVDRGMVKKLIPEFSCGRLNEDQFKKETRAKVLTYLGFDPSVAGSLDVNDPDYYTKLSKTATLRGDTSGQGYMLWAQSLAAVTKGESEKSSLVEQLSSGKKAGYSAEGAQNIVESVDLVSGKISSAINALFNIAPANATTGGPAWSATVTSIMASILSQLVVQGTVTLSEQTKCIKTPVYNPVIPGDFTPSGTAIDTQNITQCIMDGNKCRDLLFANPNGGVGVTPRN